ncbi:flagellar biosynthetic protein FliQ [Oribacterium sinus]|jgi:flagellar biosynthesis protein fliQ|uniref:Flagellar biosynthetic protein FliQ n=2 Tax=Oribacterium TaxID=265975 RepID=A0A7W9SFX1_9FIRM|nr:flagellar biosynthetic protein FliQ [Oribacterium sinus]MBB6040681.1 flagellar biosynthetic protein FliQ [Oribacterium sinus]MBF1272108.1 flagellar biosynthetic protein FliQ [Oribacterium sinus]MBF1284032.1 flagellar biosynthetic protein FliQ [Oribacterium parvum]MBF1304805.1 flagellar biosynthetic protein FliQ [Oribacterium sinus]
MLDSAEILDIMNQTFMLSLRIAMPFLLVSMILGIVIAIFQAATSINEQTLTFVPKLIAIIIMMTVLGGTLLKTMQDFFTMIMKMVAGG